MTDNNNNEINSNGLVNPHDGLFKLFLQDKDIAREFVELYLPEEYKAICDINTLAIEPSSFIEADFTPYYNDILYSMNTQNGDKGYVYCLLEHQSSPDKMIAWRLYKYAMLAMDNHLKQQNIQNDNGENTADKKLPLVIPILFYGGSKPHPKSISLDWFDHFAYPELARKIYNQPFKIIDVNQMNDNEMMQHKRIGLMEFLYKHIKTRDLMMMKEPIAYFFALNLFRPEQIKSVLIYIFDQGKIKEPQQFIDALIAKAGEQEGDKDMTSLAQYLHETGFEKGVKQGIQKAQIETTHTIARNMLNQGCEISLIRSVTGLTDEEIKKLQS